MAPRKAPVKGRPAYFPVGLGLVSAYLKENGFEVDNELDLSAIYQSCDRSKGAWPPFDPKMRSCSLTANEYTYG